jgi:hypothetical protein
VPARESGTRLPDGEGQCRVCGAGLARVAGGSRGMSLILSGSGPPRPQPAPPAARPAPSAAARSKRPTPDRPPTSWLPHPDGSSHHAATVTLFRPRHQRDSPASGSPQVTVSAEAGRPSSPSRGGGGAAVAVAAAGLGGFGGGRRPAASGALVLGRRPRRRTRCRPARPGSGRPQALLIRISRTEPSSHNSVIP